MTDQPPVSPDDPTPTLRFGCDDCLLAGSDHCADCLVTHLCRHDHDGSVVVSLDEMRMVRRLQSVGLAPPLRHTGATG